MRQAVLLFLLLVLPACTSTKQIRGRSNEDTLLDLKSLEASPKGGDLRKRVQGLAVERYPGFTLGIIELGDEGLVKDEIQKRNVFDMVRAKAEGQGAIVITFVHGWHHSADVCDANLSCFRNVLQGISEDPDRLNKGPVIGVYLGWRGDSCRVEALKGATFYNRKKAAHRIGENAGSKVLLALSNLVHELDLDLQHKGSRGFMTMVTAGHSFGGALVFSAVERALVSGWGGERLGVGDLADDRGVKPARSGLGNLVILVNPAFEAQRYHYFDEDLELPKTYAPECPILLTVASKGDDAVGKAFPLGRLLWILWHPWRWGHFAAEVTGAGRYYPQMTHELAYGGPPAKAQNNAESCSCPFPTPEQIDQIRQQLRAVIIPPEDHAPCAALRAADLSSHLPDGITLTDRRRNFDKSSPYLVFHANANLIPGHSDIYNPNFVKFIVAYLRLYLQTPPPARPAK